MSARQQIVVLGMMTKMPVAGVVWQTLHYLVGLERLGYEAYYVEAHARTPSMLMELPDDDSSGMAAAFIAGTMERFGFRDRWAFHALHDDGRCYGMSADRLAQLYRSAALIINLHGGTEPRPEHIATDRLVFLETDPVEVELQLAQGRQTTVDYLRPHCAYFTFGENYGRPDCLLPVSPLFNFQATRQPVVLDYWRGTAGTPGNRYTTIGNWRQQWHDVEFQGENYSWSKHHEFLKFLELPNRVGANFELALGGCEDPDRTLLEQHGWRVREAKPLSLNIDIYRQYIAGSRGEFTVAKDQNVRLRTGWFSDRAATYLAAGRPVINQDTGFGNALPVGEGLFAFATLDDIVAAVEAIESDYERHSRAAQEIAREYFDSDHVLGRLLERVGMPRIAPGLVVAPSSRRPTTLLEDTDRAVLEAPLPLSVLVPTDEPAEVSVVVVAHDGLVFTRLCLESVLASQGISNLEVIVVDNCSGDGTGEYLHQLAERDHRLRLITNRRNVGFAAAANQGLAEARGQRLVLLNNDTIVPPGSLRLLTGYLDDPEVGSIGPVTNRTGNEAQVDAPYQTYAGLLEFAAQRARDFAHRTFAIRTLAMFCLALRREAWELVGFIDERFGIGLLEDDDYAERLRRAGLHLLCAEDVFVHHFGEVSFGRLVPTGEYSRLLRKNQKLFEDKWGAPWEPYDRRPSAEYLELRERIRSVVREALPQGSTVAVVSRGDDELLRLDGLRAWHFPQAEDGSFAGHYPADGADAVVQVERVRAKGAHFFLVPRTAFWWLEYYNTLRTHLEDNCQLVSRNDSCVLFALDGQTESSS